MTPEEEEFWRQCEASGKEVESWPAWKRAAAARGRVTPRPDADLIESIRKRVEAWPAWKHAAAAAGLFTEPVEKRPRICNAGGFEAMRDVCQGNIRWSTCRGRG